jgi:hypothetical protein
MDFTDVVAKIVDQNSRLNLIQGVVTALGNYSVSVQLRGDTTILTGIKYLDSYVPNVNDTVFLIVNKGDLLVIGKLAIANKSLNPVAYRTTDLTILQNTDTTITFQAAANDSWGMWSASAPTVLTCKLAGRYLISASTVSEGQSNIGVSLSLFKGTQEIARLDEDIKVASHGHHMNLTSMPITLAVNDTVSMKFLHDHNPDLDLVITTGGVDHTGLFNAISAIYLGP